MTGDAAPYHLSKVSVLFCVKAWCYVVPDLCLAQWYSVDNISHKFKLRPEIQFVINCRESWLQPVVQPETIHRRSCSRSVICMVFTSCYFALGSSSIVRYAPKGSG